jgi:ABC-type transport system involved in cytochrome bd biosynthesis fused ATPase/permease subunit
VRVTVPVVSTAVAGGLAIALTLALSLPVGLVMLALGVVVCLVGGVAARLESRSLPDLLTARAEVTRVSELMATQADELRAVGGWQTALGWVDDAHATLDRVTRRIAVGRAAAASLFLVAVGAAVAVTAVVAQGLAVSTPVKALLVLTPVAVSEAVSPLVDAMRALARARGSERRIGRLLDLAPAVAGESTSDDAGAGSPPHHTAYDEPAVETRDLTASWTGTTIDLTPTDLDVPAGSRVVITGPNGSGKSTLLAVLARHLDPATGTYHLGGTNTADLSLAQARSNVAVVDDDTHVFATTLRNNLTLARPDADDTAVEEALGAAGLAPLFAALPDGLDTPLGATGRGLSGGERARLGIARAHLSDRPLVLLDEPVAHLDPPTARAVLADLTGRAPEGPDRTIIMVTHRDDGVDLFDRVIEVRRRPSATMAPIADAAPDGRTHDADHPGR